MWKSKEKRCVECLWDGIGFFGWEQVFFQELLDSCFFQELFALLILLLVSFFRIILQEFLLLLKLECFVFTNVFSRDCALMSTDCNWITCPSLSLMIFTGVFESPDYFMYLLFHVFHPPKKWESPQKNDLSTDCTSMRSPSFVSHHLLSLAFGSKPIQKTCIYWKVHPWQLPAAPFWIHLLPQLSCCSLIHLLHTRGGEHQSNLWLMQSTPWASARFCGWTVFHLSMLRRPTLSTAVLVWWAGMVMVVILLWIASPANAVAWCLLSLGVIVNVIYWKNITIIFVDWMMQRWQLKDALCQPLMLTSLGITYHWKIWSS